MRLGDDIDDHCSSCKRTTDHSVVSMMGEEVLRTRCRTCNSEHKYRQNKSRNKEMTAKEAFDKVLASVTGAQPETPSTRKRTRNNHKGHEGTQRITENHEGSETEMLRHRIQVFVCSISAILAILAILAIP